ncbi:Eco57I restriction-modification methylase domain-containing protein [Yersinia pseudotuberculosis]|uniref:Eco57I restriction-modification methylase domain-containing protein n=1 Tax=Yersinia pseudotuberculosis TaxID=633 RepID=UPI001A9F315D|nr:type IIL restriction-modification enzyme MmeI [Yersinia pseudotuberculosis]MBO1549609.1 ATP phosphoribosyltransferase regulatory subunit [Yersinia pseudotuberculosis]MBO1569735.1 ATP phosphoribosyltransferase regulatory subunit [Yersinia pseudotuberculosis]MBO1584733.1 ATP phosphoribosyltransferase regulatory subunit [Yersinia pseudotuberculosis]MBO1633751.1 ATP phosphoribosyltransferase regulatory subunit [Yersinia pseudotuberculosis]
MSLTNLHADWLSLIDISGPFLAIPVLMEAFPQGLEELHGTKRKRVRQAYDEWREALEQEDPHLIELHYAWLDEVLSRILDLDEDGKSDVLKRVEWCANHLESVLPDHGVAQYPDLAVVDEQRANKPLMLIHTYRPDVDLEATMKRDGWITTPADRMVQLCRSLDCRLGLVTNGERWMLVDAPIGAVTSFSSWYARLWNQEPITLQAFVHLLGIRRFFVNESEQLPALFDGSLKYQDEVTDALGEQVRRAVEVLIQSLDKADQDRNRELLHNVKETELYEAALTVMMRLVFLLSAEERGLLLLGDDRYETNYAISTLRMQLRKESSEILERRWDAWSRLLAIFRAVYCGVEHENLRLPALGSSLFDPDHFPFLEGRAKGSNWRTDTAKPLPIDNRTVLLLLEAIQQFQGRTLSYRALDVEQIGYVYEGLLERTVRRIGGVTLELDATKKAQSPWVKLAELDSANMDGIECLVELLQEHSGSSVSRVRKDLTKTVDDTLADRLLTTCQGDIQLRDRIKPYVHLLRTDPWGYPLVYPAGAFIVTSGSNRRETGTHYTPKSLTETIVTETLTPMVYIGPVEGTPREAWKLKSPVELLDIKICDPAMGSGAFLVQACRWLADRLVEAWSLAEKAGKTVSTDGYVLEMPDTKELLPRDTDARIVIARRLIAERCLYGVDLNPLAVELAKLSIWLVTLAKGRPFGFLDHNLRCGDSLLGIHRIDQLTQLSMNPITQGQLRLLGKDIKQAVHEAIALRQQLRETPIRDVHDVESMAQLNTNARVRLDVPGSIADAFIGEVFAASGNAVALETALVSLAIQAEQAMEGDKEQLTLIQKRTITTFSADLPTDKLSRKPFHWPLEFPEVFERCGGFDCIVGNPPFLGGQKITGTMGDCYREYLVNAIAGGKRGSADLVAYFFIKANSLLAPHGFFGLIAVNTISEGNTREVGLDSILNLGSVIYRAIPNLVWPGKANVVTSSVFISKSKWNGPLYISDHQVSVISAALTQRENWRPVKLKDSCGLVFQGVITLGEGFLIDNETYTNWVDKRDKSCEIVFDYLIGKEVNQSPTHAPSRRVINFFDLDESAATQYSSAFNLIEKFVKPERQRQKDGEYVLRSPLPQRWWQYGEKRPALFHKIGRGSNFISHPKGWNNDIKPLKRVIVFATGATKYPCFTLVPNTYIYANTLCVIASDSYSLFACLSSDIHAVWAWEHGSRMKQDLRYTHGDIFETFPFPSDVIDQNDQLLSVLGAKFFEERATYMVNENQGMTKFYNAFHNPEISSPSLSELRKLQVKINLAVLHAYGFDDLDLSHDFHEVAYLPEGKNIRYTISEFAREELLYRLANLNRIRHEEEQRKGSK